MNEYVARYLHDNNFSETAQFSGYIVWQKERVKISKEFCFFPLNLNRFPRTMMLLNELHNLGIETVGQLPHYLEELLELPSVGTVTVSKFFDHMKELLSHYDQFEASTWEVEADRNSVQQLGYILWNKERVAVHEEDYVLKLDPSKYVMAAKLVAELHQHGIQTVGELPAQFQKLLQYKSVGRTVVTKFLEQLKNELSVHQEQLERERFVEQKQLERQRFINELPEEERINIMLQEVKAKWIDWAKPEVAKHSTDRAIQMLYYRWENKKDGKHATFEETSAKFGVSRDRVRQVIIKQLKRLQPDILELLQEIRNTCGELRYFLHIFRNDDSFIQDVIMQALSANNIAYIENYQCWTTEFTQTESTFKEIQVWSHQRYKGVLITPTMLSDDCKEYSSIHRLPEQLVERIVKDCMIKAGSYGYILSNSHKSDIVEMMIRSFPEGIEIYNEWDHILTMLNGISNGQFHSKREVTSILTREEVRDIVYLWSSGKYIHHSYVHVDLNLIREIILKVGAINKKSISRSARSMQEFFEVESYRLQQAGVPNENVLYGVIKRHCSDMISHCSFPTVWLK